MARRVGIDLGTTFSAVAYIDEATGKPKVLKNHMGEKLTPSVLCFQDDGTVLFGQEAKDEQSFGNPNAVAFFKRLMGDRNYEVEFAGKRYTAEDLSAILLEHLKKDAEMQLHDSIDSAVITVPAYFGDAERKATKNAGKRAGLDVIAIINEPTAAAYAYGLSDDITKTILIYDLGGGTFDVTVAKITDREIHCVGTDGDHSLGGKDWDDTIVRYLADQFEEETGTDLRDDSDMMAALLVTAENAKKQLSVKDSVSLPLKYHRERVDIQFTLETFNAISSHLIQRTQDVINRLFTDIHISWCDIDGVILVGGSTRMRMVKVYVTEMCGQEPLSGVDVDEAVALGAAIRAHIDTSGKYLVRCGDTSAETRYLPSVQGAKAVTDVIAHSLGVISVSEDGERYINTILIKRNSVIPASFTKPFKIRTRAREREIEVYVLQGEEELPLDNTILNKYVIHDIEKVQSGESVVNITYGYSEDGVVEVSAVQTETGKSLPVRMDKVPDDMSWVLGSPKDQITSTTIQPDIAVMLTIDTSGSMTGEPIQRATQEMLKLVDQLSEFDAKIGVLAFAEETRCLIEPTNDYAAVKSEIQNLSRVDVGCGTSADPFPDCTKILTSKGGREPSDRKSLFHFTKNKEETPIVPPPIEPAICYIVVLTDGCWGWQDAAIRNAKIAHQKEINVIALGFGDADHQFLRKIASTDDFAEFTSLSELSTSFSKIAQVIGGNAIGLSR